MATSDQRQRLRSFCDLNLRKKKVEAKFKELSKPSKLKINDVKHKFETYMREQGLTRASARVPGSGERIFLTLIPTTTHRRIDPNVVGFGIEAFAREVSENADDYRFSSTHEMLEHVIDSVTAHITAQRKTETEKFKLHKKKPKKMAADPFVDVSSDLQADVAVYSKHTQAVGNWTGVRKQELAAIDTQLKATQPHVMQFLNDKKITSQRVTLGDSDAKYFVRKKISRTTPNLTNKDMKEVVRAAVRAAASQNDFDTVDDVIRGTVLQEAILHQMSARPKKEAVRLTLDRGGGSRAKKKTAAAEEQAPAEVPLPSAGLSAIAEEDEEV